MTGQTSTVSTLVAERNQLKKIYTAGPASLLPENLTGLRPCFGRGDLDYDAVEQDVLTRLKSMSGHAQIVRLQGSASLALEIATLNFLHGRVLVVSTGYYSDRLLTLVNMAKQSQQAVTTVTHIDYNSLNALEGNYDWIVACSTETSVGLKLPIEWLSNLTNRLGAKLMLDATASIGLEEGHDQADVIAYSSCKGLFGLTGAAFIAYNDKPSQVPNSFYLNMETHINHGMTGPYHAIASLYDVLPKHHLFKAAVVNNKRVFLEKIGERKTQDSLNQPLLCTWVDCAVTSTDASAVLYKPRGILGGSVVCHLGEVHLEGAAQGRILDALTLA